MGGHDGQAADVVLETDASLAPGADRSRSGVIIKVGGILVHWSSTKQSIVAISSCDAEINATVTGVKLAMAIRTMVEGILQDRVVFTLFGDNQAALISIQTEITSWRSRHYGMRATWVRDWIKEEEIEVYHKKGTELTADALTKSSRQDEVGASESKVGFNAVQ